MNDHQTETQEARRRKPALIAYSVKPNGDEQPIWTRIGAAWPHKKGPGFSIELDALPLEGRIVLVAPTAEPKAASAV
jgi:hypothetical protein